MLYISFWVLNFWVNLKLDIGFSKDRKGQKERVGLTGETGGDEKGRANGGEKGDLSQTGDSI